MKVCWTKTTTFASGSCLSPETRVKKPTQRIPQNTPYGRYGRHAGLRSPPEALHAAIKQLCVIRQTAGHSKRSATGAPLRHSGTSSGAAHSLLTTSTAARQPTADSRQPALPSSGTSGNARNLSPCPVSRPEALSSFSGLSSDTVAAQSLHRSTAP